MIESGIVDRNYVMKLLPKIFNARWITTAIRILRLYMQTENPCDELVVMVNFIMKAYGPCLFSIHLKPEVWNAPNHFYQYLKWSEEVLSVQHFGHIFKCFVRNGYSAHPEALLFAGKCKTCYSLADF